MSLKHLDRLGDVQEEIINKTDDHLKQLRKYKQDYSVLRERLIDLGDQITYDIMVPFGTVAFMPGKLVHTNEIRVYLGDGWFVDRSAKQAIEIIDRRIQNIDLDVSEFERQKDLLKPHLDFTKEFKEEGRESFEITEECSEEELVAWKAEHRLNVRKYRREQMEAKKTAMTKEEEELYWQQMDEQERCFSLSSANEEQGMVQLDRDLSSHVENHSNDLNSGAHKIQPPASLPGSSSRKNVGKTVRWKDVVQEESEKKEEEEESSDDSEEYVELCRPTVINFVHTPSSGIVQRSSPNQDGVRQIISPADIGPSFISTAPKSILKKRPSIEEEKINDALRISNPSEEIHSSYSKGKEGEKPVTSTSSPFDTTVTNHGVIKVIEKNINSDTTDTREENSTCNCDRDAAFTNSETNKRVSKFKAARTKKNSIVK